MAKDKFVVDSSVVTKWFLSESHSDGAIRVRDAFATSHLKLAAPTLLFYEVTNALRYSGVFKETELTLVARSLSKYKFDIWRPRGRLLELSAQLSVREDLTVYDACYVALAQTIGSQVITDDEELLGRFPAYAARLDSVSWPTN